MVLAGRVKKAGGLDPPARAVDATSDCWARALPDRANGRGDWYRSEAE